jgi:hypothetical protein
VQLGDRVQVGVALERADQAAGLHAQRAPDVDQHLVAGGLDDDLVEAGVVDHQRVQVAGLRGAAHPGELLAEQPAALFGDPRRGLASGDLLERGPHRVDLDELLAGHLAHPGAAVRLRLDEPHGLEVPQGLAHGGLADAELGRDGALDDALTGPVGAVQDALDDAFLDGVTEQHRALSRPGHASTSHR